MSLLQIGWGFPGGTSGKKKKKKKLKNNPPANAGDIKRYGFKPWVRKIPWRMAWQPTPVFLPGQFHGQKSLEGYSS